MEVSSESENTLLSDRVLFVTVICGCVCVFTCVYVFIYVECSRAAVNQRGHRCLTASFPPICSQGSTLQLAPVIKSVFFLLFFFAQKCIVFYFSDICNDMPSKQ